MAKDILVNTQSGDFLVSEDISQTAYWSVVWGKLFDSDEAEYMNIVVPSGYINDIQLKDNKFECKIQAEYYPVNSDFLVRLVVLNVATGKYVAIQEYVSNAPSAMGAVYYPTFTSKPQNIAACQLPLIDIDGHFKVVFQQYNNGVFSRAIICSAKDTDFSIGSSDGQSAQLLARCAPGKYYRYPSTGLDLTQYINSVVEHTDLTESLVSQFSSDSKQISEAEFDNTTGDFQVVFSGTKEANDENLDDTKTLDVSLFRMADDDFIRSAYKVAHNTDSDNTAFVEGLIGSPFIGLYDVGCSAQLEKMTIDSIMNGCISGDGTIATSENKSLVATMVLEAGKMYAVCYTSDVIQRKSKSSIISILNSTWSHESLFAIYTKSGELIYYDEPFSTESVGEYQVYRESFQNRRCFIPLQDLIVKFYAGNSTLWLSDNNSGIKALVDESNNYNTILGLVSNELTGKLTGVIALQSQIEDVKIDIETNQILIIKQNE
jgi:hypothetical protein